MEIKQYMDQGWNGDRHDGRMSFNEFLENEHVHGRL